MKYKEDRQWSDKFLPQIKTILLQHAIILLSANIADDKKDTEQATDMIISVDGGDVAVRIRRAGYYKKYRDWTIRSFRESGQETELSKLRKGHARWYLYLWTDDKEKIIDFIFIDLNRVREIGLLDKKRKHISNKDGTYFIAISIPELKKNNCLVTKGQQEIIQTSLF